MITVRCDDDNQMIYFTYNTKESARLAKWLVTYDPLTTRLDKSAAKLVQQKIEDEDMEIDNRIQELLKRPTRSDR